MLKDMTESFGYALEKDRNIILDNYTPGDGLYIRMDIKKPVNQIDENQYLMLDTKQEIPIDKLDIYNWFKERDYCSQILSTNKAVDLPAKKILSSNYLSYFIQKDRFPGCHKEKSLSLDKLKDLTERYYERLKNAESYFEELIPEDMKFKTGKKAEELEEFLQTYYYEEVSYIRSARRRQDIENCKGYILKNIENIIDIIKTLDDELKIKGYIKIFFEDDIEKYRQEHKIYLIPRIFNVKKYNILENNKVLGLPISDMTTNIKKPFLLLRTMNCLVPMRDTVENVEMNKRFYDWMTYKIKEEQDVFKMAYNYKFDGGKSYNNKGAFYLINMELSKNTKKYEITDFDNIPLALPSINSKLENILRVPLYDANKKNYLKEKYEEDRTIDKISTIQYLVSQYYFNGEMKGYFNKIEPKIKTKKFTHVMKILFMESRDAFFDYFHKGIDTNIKKNINYITLRSIEEQIKSTVEGTRLIKMKKAYNLRLFLLKHFQIKGGREMSSRLEKIVDDLSEKVNLKEMVYCDNDDEFYFLSGQLAYYLISQSEASNKNFGLFEPFLLARNSNQLKRRLEETFNAYSHKISINYIKFKNAMAMVMAYETETKITDEMKDLLIAGILSNNFLYQKQEG